MDTVGLVPLDVANPEGGAGQLSGVGVYFQAQHLVGLDQRIHFLPALGVVEVDYPLLQIQQGAQGDVEEVPAATGGVEDGNGAQPLLKGFEPVSGG